jgi:Tol biopolymer transport system component
VLPRAREIALVRPDGSEDRTIVNLQLGEFVADVALSPDGTRIAFGMFTSGSGTGAGGSDIVVAPVGAGTERTVVVPRDRPGMLLAAPQWSPDGSALVFEAVGLSATGQASVTAEWVSADGTGRRTIAQSGRYPSFSPDGQTIVYTKALPTGDALWEQPLDGGPGRQILPDSAFLLITFPRYSPDGQTIALTGVGDAVPGVPSLPKLMLAGPRAEPGTASSLAAHGFPAEPFVVSRSGGEPRRLTPLPIDDAALAWSPDGAWVAVSGANGLFLVATADGSSRRVSENGSFGAIDWR